MNLTITVNSGFWSAYGLIFALLGVIIGARSASRGLRPLPKHQGRLSWQCFCSALSCALAPSGLG